MGQPFYLNQHNGQDLTVVLYWSQPTGIDTFQNGHAALIINTRQCTGFDTEYYVSWVGAAHGRNPFKRRAEQNTLYDDMTSWGGFPARHGHLPTRWVAISGLNIANMKTEWDQMRTKQAAHWKLLDKNCATSVARVVKAGGGDGLATAASNQVIWWPTDLIRYARSMGPAIAAHS